MNNNWMTHLKEHSQNSTRKAPDGLLDDIKKEMSRRGLMPVSKPKKTHIIGITPKRIIAAAAILIFIIGTAVYVKRLTLNIERQLSKVDDTEQNSDASSNETANLQHSTFNSQHSTLNVQRSTLKVAHGCAQNSNNVERLTLNDERQLSKVDAAKEEPAEQNLAVSSIETESSQRSTFNVQHKTSLGVYYGNMAGNSIDLGTKYGDGVVFANEPFYNAPITDYDDNAGTYVATTPTINDVNHHQPIRVGLSLKYAISRRWSLLTGINYSYLQSDFSSYNNRTSTDKKQKLHYIGIPVNLSYTLWQKKNFNLYLIAGGQAEKLVKGQTETTTTQHNQSTTNNTENVHENKLVFSTNASLGVEYQLGKFIGLFAEPGVSYYFKNGSGIESSYTEKPFNFNFNLGIRVNFNVE
jgi:hypothetical protein